VNAQYVRGVVEPLFPLVAAVPLSHLSPSCQAPTVFARHSPTAIPSNASSAQAAWRLCSRSSRQQAGEHLAGLSWRRMDEQGDQVVHSTRIVTAVVSALLGTACSSGSVAKLHMLPDPNATIVGRVIDNYHHRPLADAIVEVEGTNATGRTDSLGNFRIYAVPPGLRVLRTLHIAFYPGRGEIVLRPGSTHRIRVGIDVVMACLDECEGREPKPTPGFVHVVSVTPSEPTIDAMSLIWCDSTPMKPVGRMVKIPAASVPAPGLGAVVGSMSEAETGDALVASGVALIASAKGGGQSRKEQATDLYGGFAFDSVASGDYELRARSIGHNAQNQKVRISPNRVEIVRLSLRTHRCHGY
jgi:hypothetical protein